MSENTERHKMLLVIPRCDTKDWWNTDDLNVLLGYLIKNRRADENRVYVTGFSMGGFGTWAWAISSPKTFAAIAPVAGAGDSGKVEAIKHLPIWVFHGKRDRRVGHDRAEAMVNALKSKGAKRVNSRLTPIKVTAAPFVPPSRIRSSTSGSRLIHGRQAAGGARRVRFANRKPEHVQDPNRHLGRSEPTRTGPGHNSAWREPTVAPVGRRRQRPPSSYSLPNTPKRKPPKQRPGNWRSSASSKP